MHANAGVMGVGGLIHRYVRTLQVETTHTVDGMAEALDSPEEWCCAQRVSYTDTCLV